MVALVQEQFGESKNFDVEHANSGRSDSSFRRCADCGTVGEDFVALEDHSLQDGKSWSRPMSEVGNIRTLLSGYSCALVAVAWCLMSAA